MKANRLAAFGLATGLFAGGAAGLALGVPGLASAQSEEAPATPATPPAKPDRPPKSPGGHRGHLHHRGLDAAATALGMTPAELRTALQGGQTLAQVAQSKGIAVDAVVDAMLARATERTRAFVNGEGKPFRGGHRHNGTR